MLEKVAQRKNVENIRDICKITICFVVDISYFCFFHLILHCIGFLKSGYFLSKDFWLLSYGNLSEVVFFIKNCCALAG